MHDRKIWSNIWVCNVIETGYKIPFKHLPRQRKVPSNPQAVGPAHDILVQEALNLQTKHAVVEATPCLGQYISSYFAIPKLRSPGKFRPILNLKKLNKSIKKYKFKMETLAQIRDWLQKDAWICTLDIKDQFLHVPINEKFHKFLRFSWLGKLLEWTVLPFGLKCSPRVVTKVLKPVMAFFRTVLAILISIYIDDMIIQAKTPEKALEDAQLVTLILMALGWSLNWEKSCFIPSQEVKHLGFIINSNTMTIKVPEDKVERLQNSCRIALNEKMITVHDCEKILGYMESVRPAVKLAALHYRPLQRQLLHAKSKNRIPDQIIFLSTKSKAVLKWWVSPSGFPAHCTAPLREPHATVDIWTDASLSRGGGCCSRGGFFQRHWSEDELVDEPHISILEARAAKESVINLSKSGDFVRLFIDNFTALSYIKKQGGTRSYSLNQEASELWSFTTANNITLLTPQWIGSKENSMADFLSRSSLHHWEFCLDRVLFRSIIESFQVYPTLDAFASQQTTQLPRYMSWYQDSQAVGLNALLLPWDRVTYLFPPVPLLAKVVQKVHQEHIRAILICPRWPSALWWPLVLDLMVEPPISLPHQSQALVTLACGQTLPYLEPLVALHLKG